MTDVLRKDNYKNIIPSANTLEEAIDYIKKLYATTGMSIYSLSLQVMFLPRFYYSLSPHLRAKEDCNIFAHIIGF